MADARNAIGGGMGGMGGRSRPMRPAPYGDRPDRYGGGPRGGYDSYGGGGPPGKYGGRYGAGGRGGPVCLAVSNNIGLLTKLTRASYMALCRVYP